MTLWACKLLSTDHRGGAVTGWEWGTVTGEGACVEAKKGHSLRTARSSDFLETFPEACAPSFLLQTGLAVAGLMRSQGQWQRDGSC